MPPQTRPDRAPLGREGKGPKRGRPRERNPGRQPGRLLMRGRRFKLKKRAANLSPRAEAGARNCLRAARRHSSCSPLAAAVAAARAPAGALSEWAHSEGLPWRRLRALPRATQLALGRPRNEIIILRNEPHVIHEREIDDLILIGR